MKPFNLEEALAGKPVVTTEGKKVTVLHYFEDIRSTYPLLGIMDGQIINFTKEGKYTISSDSVHDLVMQEEEKLVELTIRDISETIGVPAHLIRIKD